MSSFWNLTAPAAAPQTATRRTSANRPAAAPARVPSNGNSAAPAPRDSVRLSSSSFWNPVADPASARLQVSGQATAARSMSGGLDTARNIASTTASGVSDGASYFHQVGEAIPGNLGRFSRFAGPLGNFLEVAGGISDIRAAQNDASLSDAERDQRVGSATLGTAGSVGGGMAGATMGAATGAAIGSAVPVIGTVIGGILGGIIGGFAGGWAGESAGEAIGETSLGRGLGDRINDAVGVGE